MKQELFQLDPLSLFSHELKTPLSTIQLSLNLLEQDFEKNKSLIPIMKKEIDFLTQLIRDGLDLRLLEQKKDLLDYQWSDFYSLIEKNLSVFDPMAKEKGLDFKITGEKNLELFADSLWLSCVLKNLLANAIFFSVNNSSIVIKFVKKENHQFFFSIKNTSALKIDSKKIFDLFYTKSLNAKKTGTGIGLSLVQAIVKAHRGKIQCLTEDQSVQISFCLPKSRLNYKKSA